MVSRLKVYMNTIIIRGLYGSICIDFTQPCSLSISMEHRNECIEFALRQLLTIDDVLPCLVDRLQVSPSRRRFVCVLNIHHCQRENCDGDILRFISTGVRRIPDRACKLGHHGEHLPVVV